jgi:hypothetical protein
MKRIKNKNIRESSNGKRKPADQLPSQKERRNDSNKTKRGG